MPVAVLILIALGALPTPAPAWDKQAGLEGSERYTPQGLVLGPDGHPVIVGYAEYDFWDENDFMVVSFGNKRGRRRWLRIVPPVVGGTDHKGRGIAVTEDGNLVVVGSTDDRDGVAEERIAVAKLERQTGEILWRLDLGDGIGLDAVLGAQGKLYVRDLEGLTALVGRDGSVVWRRSSLGRSPEGQHPRLAMSPTGDVVTPTRDHVVKLSGETGRTLWNSEYRARTVFVDANGDVLGSSGRSTVKFRSTDGSQVWVSAGEALGLLEGSDVIVADDGTVRRLRAADGTPMWERAFVGSAGRQSIRSAAVTGNGDVVVLGTRFQRVIGWASFLARLTGSSGTVVWDQNLGTGAFTHVALDQAGDVFLAARGDRGLRAVKHSGITGGRLPCGNGRRDKGEECDDGNPVNGDGCDINCTRSRCGNGVVACGEECDDGDNAVGDGCSASCFDERSCGEIDVRGRWRLEVTCDLGSAGHATFEQTLLLDQDCVTERIGVTGLDGGFLLAALGAPPRAGTGTDAGEQQGVVEGLLFRLPAEGVAANEIALDTPLSVPDCEVVGITTEAVFEGEVQERFQGRADAIIGTVSSRFELRRADGQACFEPSEIVCPFSLRVLEDAPATPEGVSERAASDLCQTGSASSGDELQCLVEQAWPPIECLSACQSWGGETIVDRLRGVIDRVDTEAGSQLDARTARRVRSLARRTLRTAKRAYRRGVLHAACVDGLRAWRESVREVAR